MHLFFCRYTLLSTLTHPNLLPRQAAHREGNSSTGRRGREPSHPVLGWFEQPYGNPPNLAKIVTGCGHRHPALLPYDTPRSRNLNINPSTACERQREGVVRLLLGHGLSWLCPGLTLWAVAFQISLRTVPSPKERLILNWDGEVERVTWAARWENRVTHP